MPFSSLRGFINSMSFDTGMPSSGESAFAVPAGSSTLVGSAYTYRASTLRANGAPVLS